MPKKEHIHVVTDERHKAILVELGKKYGSMTKAFETAIEHLDSDLELGSCSDCEVRLEAEQMDAFRELLNTVTLSADNIQELVRYMKGDCSARELIIRSREKAGQFVKQYLNYLTIKPDNTYENLLANIEEYKKRTRLFKTVQVDRFENEIVARINILEEFPILVAMGLQGFLEALNFTFDIDIVQQDIILKWLTPGQYQDQKLSIQKKIDSLIDNAEHDFKPYMIKKGFVFINPELLDWLGERIFRQEIFPTSVAFFYISALGDIEPPETAEETAKLGVKLIKDVNFAEEIRYDFDNSKNRFTFRVLCQNPNMARILFQGATLVLGKWGWKLKRHRLDGSQLNLTYQYVGLDDSNIYDPLYLENFTAYINQQFQELRLIPHDEFDDLTKSLYELDRGKFHEIFKKQGLVIGNAIKLFANHDLKKMREIAYYVLPKTLQQAYREPKGINFIPELGKFTMVFKKTNRIEMEIFRSLIVGVAESFEYRNISSKTSGNVVTIEFTRPDEAEVVEMTSEEKSSTEKEVRNA